LQSVHLFVGSYSLLIRRIEGRGLCLSLKIKISGLAREPIREVFFIALWPLLTSWPWPWPLRPKVTLRGQKRSLAGRSKSCHHGNHWRYMKIGR